MYTKLLKNASKELTLTRVFDLVGRRERKARDNFKFHLNNQFILSHHMLSSRKFLDLPSQINAIKITQLKFKGISL